MADTQPANAPSVVLAASNPTVVPPQPQTTYDRWWLRSINIQAPSPDSVTGRFVLQKYTAAADGSIQFSPVDPQVILTIPDILNDPDPSIQQATMSLLIAIQAQGQKQGLL